ncbi:MAG: sigma-70 family RNA polymerase sigma factor [Flavobacteriales bacterium]|jgi:RNA polymerase sigma-70 factor (ECF subfamily)|nr:sigma-70 family RNA polymerase sigma factor [Flavobacteriales bacterium]
MKLEQEELEKIIEGCKKRHRLSQQKVYEMFYGRMLPVCKRYAKNSEEAKDILQNGFIKVFEKIDKYDFNGSFGGWVRRLIVNTAIDHYRKHKNEFLIEDESRIEDNEHWYEEEPTTKYEGISTKDIQEAIGSLSPAYKMVFSLYIMEGFSHQEIADELGISVGTSKSNLAKAKANVKKLLMKKLKNGNKQIR